MKKVMMSDAPLSALLISDVHVDRVHAQEGITRCVSR